MNTAAIVQEYLSAPTIGKGTRPVWLALARDTARLYAGLPVRVQVVDGQPYSNVDSLRQDMARGRLLVSSVALGEHPIWTPEENARFRAVHDFYGHSDGPDFTLTGEFEAWYRQASVTRPDLSGALYIEVVGQAAVYYHAGGFPPQRCYLPRAVPSNVGEGRQ